MTKRSLGRSRNAIVEINKNALITHPRPDWDPDWTKSCLSRDVIHRTSRTSFISKFPPVSPSIESSITEGNISQTCTSSSISSESSWTDDGFEQEATEKVQELFDAIDCALYENNDLPEELKELNNECQYWRTHYPHLRVNGVKLDTNETDLLGISFVAPMLPSRPDVNKLHFSDTAMSDNEAADTQLSLMVKGISLKPETTQFFSEHPCQNNFEDGRDEIIAVDGIYEELIAVDKDESSSFDESQSETLTPQHIQRAVMGHVMKNVWKEVISNLRPTLLNYIDNFLKGFSQQPLNRSVEHQLGYINGEPPVIYHSTVPTLSQGATDLQGLLTISSKTLLSRNINRPRTGAQMSATAIGSGDRLSSPSKPANRSSRGRLAPIGRSPKQTPSYDYGHQDDVRPAAIAMNPTSPRSWGRHFPLPPIESSSQLLPTSGLTELQRYRSSNPALRMLSAISSHRSLGRDSNKLKLNAYNYPASNQFTNIRSNRLFSAQVDSMRSYPVSYAAIVGERIKSSSRTRDDKITSGYSKKRIDTTCTVGTRELSSDIMEHRFSTGCLNRGLERKSNR